jgi:DNA-binding NarL/FixJ family response regulator
MTCRVVIADDHPVFRHGLRAVLTGIPGIEVVGEAADGATAVRVAVDQTADVVLMDLQMPGTDGLDAIRALAEHAPTTRVVVLTMFDNDESLLTALRAGAHGYLVKGADEDQITRAILAVAAGDVVFAGAIAARALAYFTAAPSSSRAARPFPELTDRELDVLSLLADGNGNAAIAAALHLSDKTVRNYVANILTKLQATDRGQATVRARQAGLGQAQPAPRPGQ